MTRSFAMPPGRDRFDAALRRIGSVLPIVLASLWISGGAQAGTDEDFLAAREAFRVGDARKLDLYAKRLSGYVLEPYVAYWQFRLRLDTAGADDVRAFLSTYRDTYVAERLRIDWLKLLGKNQQWDIFDAETAAVGDDIELTCYALQSKLRKGDEVLQEARPLWFVPKELPESCTPLIAALTERRLLSEEDIWTRVRLTLEAGQVSGARRAAQWLPAGVAPDAAALNAVYTNPGGYLERTGAGIDTRSRAAREVTMFAVYRLARTTPQQAAAWWTRLESRFGAEDRAYVWGQIAYFGAMRHDPSALEWYSKAKDLSDLQLAWKARTALRARNWKEVQAAIDAMTGKERQEPAWRYWKARALKAQGREEEAVLLLKPLSQEYHFYGQLALEELGGRVSFPATAFKPAPADIQAIQSSGGIRRSLALFQLGMRVEGTREWLHTIRQYDDRQLLAAAEVARRSEIYDRAINTADRTAAVHDFNLRYLAPYRDMMKVHVGRTSLDEAWVYGLIRQESRFISEARSSVGAGGLMQLMPATAKWVAGKMGLKDWRWSRVTDVDTNLSLGTYYLKHVYDSLDSQAVLASAAYNAGPGRARAWRPDVAIEGAAYAETIPFNETRDYVKKVMSNATYYAGSFTQQLQSLKERLGMIGPRRRDGETSLGDTP